MGVGLIAYDRGETGNTDVVGKPGLPVDSDGGNASGRCTPRRGGSPGVRPALPMGTII
jgi:hypothetical protein